MENIEEKKTEIDHDTPKKKRKIFSESFKVNNESTSSSNLTNKERHADGVNGSETPCVADKSTVRFKESSNSIASIVDDDLHLPGVVVEPGSPDSSSGASEADWQPPTHGSIDWIHSQMLDGRDPRDIIYKLVPGVSSIPNHVSNWDVWRLLVRILSEPPRRLKLPDVNTFEDVVRLIRTCRKIMILTGAGVSVSCGIPDFRSRDGVYARLAVDFPDLPSPEAMFDISYFRHDPRPFFKFAKEIYPGQYKPSLIHRFISLLEKDDKLLRNYTQNIDTLEQVAGISRVIQCHGSFATASCQVCKHQVDCDAVRQDIFDQVVPHCPRCSGTEPGILKPDIVFFGENLPEHFHRQMSTDKDEVDLLVVIGSALKVRPVALIPNSLPKEVPQILINRERLPHMSFDVELLGDGDVIVGEICRRLGGQYNDIHDVKEGLSEIVQLPDDDINSATSPYNDASDDVETNKDGALGSSGDDARTKNTNPSRDDCISDLIEPSCSFTNVYDVVETNICKDDSSNLAEPSTNAEHISDVGENNSKDVKSDLIESNSFTENKLDGVETNHSKIVNSNFSESNNKTEDKSDVVETKDEGQDCSVSMEESDDMKDAELNGLWRSRWKKSISKRLPVGTYYYDGDHRYIFPGAEVAPEEEEESSSSDSSSDSSDDEDSIVLTGISPMQRHPFIRRSSPSWTNYASQSNSDVTTTSFPSRTIKNNEAGECSKPAESDVGVMLCSSSHCLSADVHPAHCDVESTSNGTKRDPSSSFDAVLDS